MISFKYHTSESLPASSSSITCQDDQVLRYIYHHAGQILLSVHHANYDATMAA